MADPTSDFGELLRDRLEVVVGPALIGVYLHGSAALGGFRPGVSDIDLLVVVEDPLQQPNPCGDVTRVLQESHESAPGRGIEASVILGEVARAGGHRLDFELHVCTDPNDPKVIEGAGHTDDPDLILHMAVCRQSAITAFGPQPAAVFAEVDRELVVGQMINELTWALGHGSEAYSVLNACRALFYLETRMFCSKLDGGLWARDRFGASHLIDRSLAAQQGWGDDQPPSPRSETFVAATISALAVELSNISHD